jgi:hypothetical protein
MLRNAKCYQAGKGECCEYLENGGPGRVRTDDLFHAMEARSQLRHRPTEQQINAPVQIRMR